MQAFRLLFRHRGGWAADFRHCGHRGLFGRRGIPVAHEAECLRPRRLVAVRGRQALLIWMWFALHAKRLRDAGRTIGLAVGAAVLYALSVCCC